MNKFCLIILSYNSAKFIEKTLSSILASTTSGWDVIINDDHSEDDSVAIIRDFIKNNKNRTADWRLICSQSNKGINASLLSCLHLTTARWIKYLAADDELAEGALAKYQGFVESVLDNDVLVVSDMDIIDEVSELLQRRYTYPSSFYSGRIFKGVHLYTNTMNAPSVMISKSLLIASLASTAVRNAEDWPVLRTAVFSNATIVAAPESLVRYRQTSGSLSDYYRKGGRRRGGNRVRTEVRQLLIENSAFAGDIFARLGVRLRMAELDSSSASRRFVLASVKLLNLQHVCFKIATSAVVFWRRNAS